MKKVLLGFLLFSSLVRADSVNDIKIVTENYPPYNMEVNGKLRGISVEVLDAMLKQMKAKTTIDDVKLRPWATGYKLATKKKNYMLFSTTRTKLREPLFKWVGPIIATKISIIAPKNKHYHIKSIEDLKKYKIGAVINDIGEQLLKEAGIPKNNISSISGKNPVVVNFTKMGRGRIDMFAYEENVAMYGAKSFQIDISEFEPVFTLKKGQLYYAFNKHVDDKVIQKFQQALDTIKKNGVYDKIVKKYQ